MIVPERLLVTRHDQPKAPPVVHVLSPSCQPGCPPASPPTCCLLSPAKEWRVSIQGITKQRWVVRSRPNKHFVTRRVGTKSVLIGSHGSHQVTEHIFIFWQNVFLYHLNYLNYLLLIRKCHLLVYWAWTPATPRQMARLRCGSWP